MGLETVWKMAQKRNRATAKEFVKIGQLSELCKTENFLSLKHCDCEVQGVDPPWDSASVSQTGVVRHPGPNKLVCKQVSRCLVSCKHFFFSRTDSLFGGEQLRR